MKKVKEVVIDSKQCQIFVCWSKIIYLHMSDLNIAFLSFNLLKSENKYQNETSNLINVYFYQKVLIKIMS